MSNHHTAALISALAFVCAACSSDDTDTTEDETYLGLQQPDDGFQVRDLGTSIPTGADEEYCEVAELPGDPSDTYYVRSMEFANAAQSHHLIVSVAIPGSEADAKVRELDVGDRVPCLGAELAFGQSGMETVGGIQQPYGTVDFPAGVGREYYGGQRVVFDYHYYNTTDAEIEARSAFNFHLAAADDVQHLARGFGFYNWTIDTPPGETRQFVGECKFKNDVMVSALVRHTHRWGRDYKVWFESSALDSEPIWVSHDFQHEVNYSFDEPLLMKAGEGFRFECDYENTLSSPLRFGTSATDEMCILFGLIWNAGSDRDIASQDCDIVWTDADGVGHDTSEMGFPAPTQDEVNLCIAGASANGVTPDECTTCQCGACASVLIQCATDPDCGVILECIQDTTRDCTSVVDEHSSGVGLLRQVGECTEASGCTSCTTP